MNKINKDQQRINKINSLLNSKDSIDKQQAYRMIKEDKKKSIPYVLGLGIIYAIIVYVFLKDMEPVWLGMLLILGGALGIIWLLIDSFKDPSQ